MKKIYILDVARSIIQGRKQTAQAVAIKKLSYCFVILMFIFLNIQPVSAQDSTNVDDGKWRFWMGPYLMIPNMTGEITVAPLPTSEVDADPGDIFGALKFAAMVYVEGSVNGWHISTDLVYMSLEKDIKEGILVTGGTATTRQLILEFAGLRRVTKWLDAGVAARIVSLNAELDLETINGEESSSATRAWIDPVIVLRSQSSINDKWWFRFRGDVGGFGLGSDVTWQLQANVDYAFTKLFQAGIGYRAISIDYTDGEDPDKFTYNVDTYGPTVRIGFTFP